MRKEIVIVIVAGIIIFLNNRIYSQKNIHFPAELNYKQTQTGGSVTAFDKTGKSLFRVSVLPADTNTTYYYPLNQAEEQKNFSYFTNAQYFNLSFSVTSSIAVSNMRYRILRGNAADSTQWNPVNGRMVKQNEPDGTFTTNIFMDPVICNNEVVTIQLYNTKDPENILTQIVSTKVIEKPSVFGVYEERFERKETAGDGSVVASVSGATIGLRYITLYKKEQDQKAEITSGNLILITNNTPLIFQTYIIRNIRGQVDTIAIKTKWVKFKPVSGFFDHLFETGAINWSKGDAYYTSLPIEFITTVGTYKILVVPGFLRSAGSNKLVRSFPDKEVTIEYSVHPPENTFLDILLLLSVLGILALPIIAYILIKKNRQKKKLQKQEQLTREARLKLESIRAQLNPHFVYNALSGIQNLLHKQDNRAADNYLTKFSRLSRKVLENAEKDLIPIEEEIGLLDDYLQMEQMRFGFGYAIKIDEAIDKVNTEIPVMLVQPFVENAVKHAMPFAGKNGYICINFKKELNSLLIAVKDNGKGFDTKGASGKGSVLSKNRISLLNEVYTITPVRLKTTSDSNGTGVLITLNDWLA